MRIGIDEFYPKSGVEIQDNNGSDKVTMFKDIEREEGPEGETLVTADVVSFDVPKGTVDEEHLIAHFDYYFAKGAESELSAAKALKEAQVQKLLLDSDYRSHKFADGSYTASEYKPWKDIREEWRGAINAIRSAETMEALDAITWPIEPAK